HSTRGFHPESVGNVGLPRGFGCREARQSSDMWQLNLQAAAPRNLRYLRALPLRNNPLLSWSLEKRPILAVLPLQKRCLLFSPAPIDESPSRSRPLRQKQV